MQLAKGKALVLWSDMSAANFGLRVLASGARRLVYLATNGLVETDNQDFGPGDSDISFGTKAILRDIGRKNGLIKRKLRQYSVLLDSGAGDSFTDIYGLKRLSFIAYAHFQARRLGIPLILLPQTIGPFKTRLGRLIARPTMKQAVIVMARDPRSADYARAIFGRKVDAVSSDLVFALAPETRDYQTRDLIINVSGLLWFGDSHVDSRLYRAATFSLIDRSIEQGRQVSLLAHVVGSASGNDDADAIDNLLSERPDLAQVVERLVPRSLSEARRMLGSANHVVGARMHACLNALSQGVPAVAWAYSRKFEPLMAEIGWPHVISLWSSDDPVDETLRILDEYQGQLKTLAEAAARTAATSFDHVVEILKVHLK